MKSPNRPREASWPNFLGLEEIPAGEAPCERRVTVIPVPFEKTTSYVKGAGNAPLEILLASQQVELHDDETGTDLSSASIRTEGPVTSEDIDGLEKALSPLLRRGGTPVLIGGEHTITLAATRVLRGGLPFTVLSLDAHADLRDEYLGTRVNHATVMRRISESHPIVVAGVRSISGEEARALADLPATVFTARDIVAGPESIERILDALGERVYLSVDLDVFDPGAVPAVGTPEPGGLDWYQVTGILGRVIGEKSIVGMDFVELCPHPAHHASTFTAAKLICKAICFLSARS